MAIYQGADTMKAERAQSFWDVKEGKKRHDKGTLEQFGNRQLFSQGSNILEALLPQGLKQIVDVGSKQLEQYLFPMPEYKEDPGFWTASEVSALKEQDKALRSELDESLLESIIGGVEDYIGSGEGFDISSFFSSDSPQMPPEFIPGSFINPNGVSEESSYEVLRGGGRVPKYYGGGSVSGSPTISDYFSQQGKTLGGSNTQSLSQLLGRK